MKSIGQILAMVMDGKVTTIEQARQIVDEEVNDRMAMPQNLNDPIETRKIILANIGYASRYFNDELAMKLFDLFETEHPVFGRKRPSPEEALRLGIEMGERLRQKAEAKAEAEERKQEAEREQQSHKRRKKI